MSEKVLLETLQRQLKDKENDIVLMKRTIAELEKQKYDAFKRISELSQR